MHIVRLLAASYSCRLSCSRGKQGSEFFGAPFVYAQHERPARYAHRIPPTNTSDAHTFPTYAVRRRHLTRHIHGAFDAILLIAKKRTVCCAPSKTFFHNKKSVQCSSPKITRPATSALRMLKAPQYTRGRHTRGSGRGGAFPGNLTQ